MAIGRIPEPGTGIPESIVDAKGDLVTATAADTPARLAVGSNEQRLVADSAAATGLKYVADTTNYAIAAKGDLLVGTAADTLQALSVGTNGYTLVADSAQTTGVKWAAPSGGYTLLSTVTMTQGSTSSASFQNISQDYTHLFFTFDAFNPASNNVYLQGRLNNDSGSNYSAATLRATAGASTVAATGTGSFLTYMNPSAPEAALVPGSNSTAGNWQVLGYTSLWIYNYTDLGTIHYQWCGFGYDASFAYNVIGNGVYNSGGSTPVSRADFYTSSGNAGCVIRLYGVK